MAGTIARAFRPVLVGAFTAALLCACDSSPGVPVASQKTVPGAERQVGASAGLPAPPPNRQYDAGISAVDENRAGPQPLPVAPAAKPKAEKQTEKTASTVPVATLNDGSTAALPPITPGESTSSLAGTPAPTAEPPAAPAAPAVTKAPARPEPAAPPPPQRPPAGSVTAPCQSGGLTAAAQAEFTRIAGTLTAAGRIEVRAFAGGDDQDDGRTMAMGCALLVRSYLIDHGVRSRIDVNAFEAGSASPAGASRSWIPEADLALRTAISSVVGSARIGLWRSLTGFEPVLLALRRATSLGL